MRIRIGTLKLVIYLGICTTVAPIASSLSRSAEVTVVQSQEFNRVNGIEFQPDAPETTITNNQGDHIWFTPLWNKTVGGIDHMRTVQRGDDPLSKFVWLKTQGELFSYDHASFPGNFWIVNELQVNDCVLAVVHIEGALNSGRDPKTGRTIAPGKTRIGLAWSKDEGNSFAYLGEILISDGDPDPSNIQGAPLIVKGPYLYLYYHDIKGLAVARAPLAEIIAGARSGSVTSWLKYDAALGGFKSPGKGGAASGLGIDGISHSDAICDEARGACYLVLSRLTWPGGGSWVRLFKSVDLVSWELISSLAELPPSTRIRGYQYCTLASTNFQQHTFGGNAFFVFCGKDYGEPTRSLVRWTVDVSGGFH